MWTCCFLGTGYSFGYQVLAYHLAIRRFLLSTQQILTWYLKNSQMIQTWIEFWTSLVTNYLAEESTKMPGVGGRSDCLSGDRWSHLPGYDGNEDTTDALHSGCLSNMANNYLCVIVMIWNFANVSSPATSDKILVLSKVGLDRSVIWSLLLIQGPSGSRRRSSARGVKG